MRATAAIVLVILVGCNTESSAPAQAERDRAARAEAPEAVSAPAPAAPLFERQSAPRLDPAEVPVEEDFIADAEESIGKRSNLELELTRLAKEIHASSE